MKVDEAREICQNIIRKLMSYFYSKRKKRIEYNKILNIS